ncbi:DUF1080 domain-containing protein [Flavobacteriaceae bacterium F89]|uniref:DUF1080 domain-containing protein n=1 Tax=Cerina litoralis TaxID=2874477 RepID=A0AAE3JLX9_9FLAO|nr:DUF1080 domain-containing protein [Cerina litoralis]MCG2459150.1 DUF1080 domain-containing protein [Cerina litoralis]
MKNVLLATCIAALVFGCKDKTKKNNADMDTEPLKQTEMKAPTEKEWTVLFDGTSFNGWHGYLMDKVPDAWKLEDGAMVMHPPKEKSQRGPHLNLISDKDYTDFVLSLEWKISEGGNSGIFWGVKEDKKYKEPYSTGPEIQVLDNLNHPDAKNGTTHQAGSLYDMVAPSKDVTKPVGEWNTCVITVNHKTNEGRVVLNGVDIVNFPVEGEQWDAMVAKSKFADWDGFGKFHTGKIGLQFHGDVVSYRNIKIKEL